MLSQNAGKHSASGNQSGDGRVPRLIVEDACVQWEAHLKAFLLGVLRDRHLAEDAFQKMVVKAIESAEAARLETLRGWLFRIALNEARQIQRENRRDAFHLARLASEPTVDRLQAVDAGLLVDVGLLTDEVVQSVLRSLVRLPAEQQEVIRRRVYEGLTFAEIATQMNQPLGTVLTWMRRGMQRLKEDTGLRSLLDE